MIYINNNIPTQLNYQNTDIKKLLYRNRILYWSIPNKMPDPIYSSITTTYDYCDGYNWMQDTTIHYLSGFSETTLIEYSAITTTELLEENSEHCGYVPPITEKWAKFDGASYFDSGVKLSDYPTTYTTRFECEVYLKEKPTKTVAVFGSRYLNGSTYYSFTTFHTVATDGWRINLLNGTQKVVATKPETKYTLSLGRNKSVSNSFFCEVKENDQVVLPQTTVTGSSQTSLYSRNIWVGALNDSGGYASYFDQYIKSMKVYHNDILVKDFEFVEIDGSVKMHEKISDTYINQSGTGKVTLEEI